MSVTFITLVPKKENSTKLKDSRFYSLTTNSMYRSLLIGLLRLW